VVMLCRFVALTMRCLTQSGGTVSPTKLSATNEKLTRRNTSMINSAGLIAVEFKRASSRQEWASETVDLRIVPGRVIRAEARFPALTPWV